MPIDNVKQLMMKLIAENPSYLTSGIPNDLLTQMIMSSNKPPLPSPGPRVGVGGGGGGAAARPSGTSQHAYHVGPSGIMMTPGMEGMKVKQSMVYNVCFGFLIFSFCHHGKTL